MKALALVQAGGHAIGLNGVWCFGAKNSVGLVKIRADLLAALDWRGRKVYLAFDADLASKPDVRQALIRTYFILSSVGAEIYQLTTWDESQGKGVDDYLVGQFRSNGQHKPEDALTELMAKAKPFVETLSSTSLDLALCCSELAKVQLPAVLRSQLSRQLAGPLNVRVSALDDHITGQSKPVLIPSFAADYEPWPQGVDPEELLNDIMVRLNTEVIIENHQVLVSGLEIMLSWVHSQMEFSPIFFITGPDKECGKSTLLHAMAKMVKRPVKTSSATPAALFRLSELYHPSFLMDECQDQLQNPDFAQIIKAGHTPGDVAIRCDPNTNEPQTFDVFCPKVLAGIGRANGQIMSRSIVIEMERRDAKTDRSAKATDQEFVDLRRKLARWALDCGDLKRFRLPEQSGVKLRNRDNWETFYRVACAVSQSVAQQLLDAIPFFTNEEEDFSTYFLNALYKVFCEHDQLGPEGFLGSEAIIEELNRDKEAPWFSKPDSKGLTVHALSARLRRYKVKPDKVWQPEIERQLRGYRYVDSRPRHNDLKRIFTQYLPDKDLK